MNISFLDNVISIFDKTPSARIADPANPAKIFKWLLEFSCDDKGNCFQFVYHKEALKNVNSEVHVHKKNRLNDIALCSNSYLKRIKYCNKVHFNKNNLANNWDAIEYLLELVLDYGNSEEVNPVSLDYDNWAVRKDLFSDYRSGFDIRTYRLCRRVLIFHHFTNSKFGLGNNDERIAYLVRSMELNYDNGTAFTFLQSITQTGYILSNGNYSSKLLPPV